MKIALEFNKNKENIKNDLIKRNFEVSDSSSFGTTWVYDLDNVCFNGDSITLYTKTYVYYVISLNDIEYFEIHNK